MCYTFSHKTCFLFWINILACDAWQDLAIKLLTYQDWIKVKKLIDWAFTLVKLCRRHRRVPTGPVLWLNKLKLEDYSTFSIKLPSMSHSWKYCVSSELVTVTIYSGEIGCTVVLSSKLFCSALRPTMLSCQLFIINIHLSAGIYRSQPKTRENKAGRDEP